MKTKPNKKKFSPQPIDLGLCCVAGEKPFYGRVFLFEDFPELKDMDGKTASAFMAKFSYKKKRRVNEQVTNSPDRL